MKKTLLFLILFLAGTTSLYASQPLPALKGEIDKVVDILTDPQYTDEAKKSEQYDKLWNVMANVFDFKTMSRLTLGKNWKDFSSEQKSEFSDIFAKFLGKIYLDKLQSGFSGEKVNYKGEDIITSKKAEVMTTIIRNGVETPVNYMMVKAGDTWKIYDVKIEGVSLLKNYRTQFTSILMKDKPQDLIEILKKKI